MSRRVFISYRRKGDGAGFALALQNQLQDILGAGRVYLDTNEDAIPVGEPWRIRLEKAVLASDTVLAIIDSTWTRRITQPGDVVEFELATALSRGRRVVPVLVSGTMMPAAVDLPQSLASLPDLQAHEIRTSSAVADTESLLRKLTGRTSREPSPTPDRVDLSVAAMLAVLGSLVWFSWGRERFNLAERWVWGLLGPLLVLLIFVVRRVASASRLGWPPRIRNRAIALTTVAVIASSTFALSLWWIYRVPAFPPDTSGFLIARFSLDSLDEYQRALKDSLSLSLSPHRLDERGALIEMLPRRVTSDQMAKTYGIRSGASVVLWGRASAARSGRGGAIDARISFVDVEGAFEGGSEYVRGTFGLADSPLDDVKLTGDLGLLQEVLPPLLIGYRLYRTDDAAVDNYARPLALLNMAFGKLESAPAARFSNQLRALRATLNLYRGNIYFLRGDRVGAEREFRAAIDASTQDVDHAVWFIEPLNNLGFVYLESGRIPEALTVLGQADRECSAKVFAERRTSPICVYAWYNLGNALARARKYEDAADRAARVIKFFETNDAQPESLVDRRLQGLAHQTRAFSLVMRAAQQGTPNTRLRMADEAEVEWKRGREALARLKTAAPPHGALTLARIHAVRGDWNAALTVLRPLEKDGGADPDVSLLLSAATWCTGQHEASVAYLRRFQEASSPREFLAALPFFDNITATCP